MGNNIIEKINKIVLKNYLVEFKSETEVFEDDFEEGEIECVNHWTNDKYSFVATETDIMEKIKFELLNYINNDELYVQYDEQQLIKSIENYDDNTYFFVFKTVDIDNTIPSKEQFELWKSKKEKLFIQNISISVLVNGVKLPADLLLEIITNN